MLTGTVAAELVETVSWGHPKVSEALGGVEHDEFPQSNSLDLDVDLAHQHPNPNPFSVLAAERLQHDWGITLHVMNVKR